MLYRHLRPMLILGDAEPTMIMYSYLYKFAKGREELGQKLYLAWAGWVCVWTAILLCLLAILNACSIIHKITRIAGETFDMLIAVLFIQEAIKGLINEFKIPKAGDPSLEKYQFQWLYTNGLLSIIKRKASSSEIYGEMQAVFIEIDKSPQVSSFFRYNVV